MWLFTRHGFFSVVRYKKRMSIRSRDWSHLDNLRDWMGIRAEILALEGTDYQFRMLVTLRQWREIAARLADEIQCTNFKNEAKENVELVGFNYVNILHRVWTLVADVYDPKRLLALAAIAGSDDRDAVEYSHGQQDLRRHSVGRLRP